MLDYCSYQQCYIHDVNIIISCLDYWSINSVT